MTSRKTALIAIVFLTVALFASAGEAATLPTGHWTVIANGAVGDFNVLGVDSAGNLNATIYGNPTTGFWDSARNHITFIRQFGPAISNQQFYDGYLEQVASGAPGQCFVLLTGTYVGFSGGGTSASSAVFAFLAVITAPCL